MIDYDLNRRPGRPDEWQALVEAVCASPEPEENYWLELKSPLDWSTGHGVGTLARAILGLANRDRDRAAATLGGYGVVIVGLAKPAEVQAVEVLDSADLSNKLGAYLGKDGPRWRPEWMKVDGKSVLLVVVEPPQNGDPIYTLRATFDNYKISQTFVREIGKTEPASEDDMKRLGRRLTASESKDVLDVTVTYLPEIPLSTYHWEESAIEAFLDAERARLMKSLAEEQAAKEAREAKAAADLTGLLDGAGARGLAEVLGQPGFLGAPFMEHEKQESRSPGAFTAQVSVYVDDLRAALPDALKTIAGAVVPVPVFVIDNNSNRNYTEIDVTIRVEGEAFAADADEDREVPKFRDLLPKRPRKYGPYKVRPNLELDLGRYPDTSFLTHRAPGGAAYSRREIRNGGSFEFDFETVDLRPGRTGLVLASDLAVVIPRHRVEPVVVSWHATASNVDAEAFGEFVLPFEDHSIDVLAYALRGE